MALLGIACYQYVKYEAAVFVENTKAEVRVEVREGLMEALEDEEVNERIDKIMDEAVERNKKKHLGFLFGG